MVKLMFASAFSILIIMSTRAIATYPSPLKFSISNQQTGYFLYDDGTETAGQNVATVSPDKAVFSTSEVFFNFPTCLDKGLAVSYRAVMNKASNLYVSVPQLQAAAGQTLVWSTLPYCWALNETGFRTWTFSTTDANGGELDWYSDTGTEGYFSLKATSGIQGNGNLFTLVLD